MVEQLNLDKVDSPEFLDTVYSLLADSRRRNVLRYLLTTRQPASIHRVATAVAASEHDVAAEEVTYDQFEDVLLLLKHVHLPMLHDTGVISWNQDNDQISLKPLIDHLSVTVSHPGGPLDVSMSTRSKGQ